MPRFPRWDDGSSRGGAAFEPDALVVCPPPADLSTLEIPNPVIVVEVLSPSTAADDHGIKQLTAATVFGDVHALYKSKTQIRGDGGEIGR